MCCTSLKKSQRRKLDPTGCHVLCWRCVYKLSGPLRGSASLLRHATRPAGAAPGAGSKEGDHPTIDIYIYLYIYISRVTDFEFNSWLWGSLVLAPTTMQYLITRCGLPRTFLTFFVFFAEAFERKTAWKSKPASFLLGSQSQISCADHISLQCELSTLKLAFGFGCSSVFFCNWELEPPRRTWWDADKTLLERRYAQLDLNLPL